MRKDGYYFVNFKGRWVVAHWDKQYNGSTENEWFLPNEPYIHPNTDNDFEEIDERRITIERLQINEEVENLCRVILEDHFKHGILCTIYLKKLAELLNLSEYEKHL